MQTTSQPSQRTEAAALKRVGECIYELPKSFRADMRVPVRVFADEEHLQAILRDQSLLQLINVATLPGIWSAALGMPDMHEGYGFPVGGVAATALLTDRPSSRSGARATAPDGRRAEAPPSARPRGPRSERSSRAAALS